MRAFSWLFATLFLVGCGDDDPVSGTGGSGNAGGSTGGVGGNAGDGGMGGTPVGGGGAGGGEVTVPKAYEDACQALHEKSCAEIFACFPGRAISDFGTEANCISERVEACVRLYRPELDVQDVTACTAAIPTGDCDFTLRLFFEGKAMDGLPPACHYTGDAADGAPCELGFECQSGFCAGYEGDALLCGVCTAPAGEGDPCDGTCEVGLACINGTCADLGGVGDPCDADDPCWTTLRCDAGQCAALIADGQACDTNVPGPGQCDWESSVCNKVTGLCEALAPPVAVGGACFIQADGTVILCDDSLCQVNVATGEGTCIAAKEEGDACSPANNILFQGSDCAPPTLCFDGTCQYVGDILVCE